MDLFIPDDPSKKPKAIYGCSFHGVNLIDIGELTFEFHVWWYNSEDLTTIIQLFLFHLVIFLATGDFPHFTFPKLNQYISKSSACSPWAFSL